jgi:hypothetical protein
MTPRTEPISLPVAPKCAPLDTRTEQAHRCQQASANEAAYKYCTYAVPPAETERDRNPADEAIAKRHATTEQDPHDVPNRRAPLGLGDVFNADTLYPADLVYDTDIASFELCLVS